VATEPRIADEAFSGDAHRELVSAVRCVALKLVEYCRTKDWAGHDPYDALNSELLSRLHVLDFPLVRLVLTQALKRAPWNCRALLRIPDTQNPKALALFLRSLLKLSKIGLLPSHDLVHAMADTLEGHRSQGTRYYCWGYSFPWQTRSMLVPKGAPNLVCTVFVANALLDLYISDGNDRHLEMAVSASRYILNELCWCDAHSRHSIAYPVPSARSRIHNANLLGAALLCRLGAHVGETKFTDAGLAIARCTAAEQRPDGSWPYGDAKNQSWIDNFHTGYNLSALHSIDEDTGLDEFRGHVAAGFRFYLEHFFRDDGASRYFHDRTYPIDIHCIAQSIITLLEFKDLDSRNGDLACSVVQWSLAHMLDPTGFFYYRMLRYGRIKTSYMRWSQAWMTLALATFLEEHQEASPANDGIALSPEKIHLVPHA
jgi:hypothetical protein